MTKQAAIIHYNTPELTGALVKSIRKWSPELGVVIFDNSDRRPFPQTEGVRIIDNTRGQVVDFDAMISRYPERLPHPSNWGSEKHIASVDALFDILTDGFLLLDPDTLLKQDVTPLLDPNVAWAGYVEQQTGQPLARRAAPYCLWINVPMLREHGIRFLHEGRIFRLSHSGPPFYDTGASFYHDCEAAGLTKKKVAIYEYIAHLHGGSWRKSPEAASRFLEQNRPLYEDRILVVIPYFAGGAQGCELEYAIAGWKRHFKERFTLVVVGDRSRVVDADPDIVFIECPRVADIPGQYRAHLDFVKKFRAVRERFPGSKGFVFVADDCYAVHDFDLQDVLLMKQKAERMRGNAASKNPWQRDKAKTEALLRREGYPTRNFTTHLPNWFDWDRLDELWRRFNMDRESYLVEDLYYNIFFGDEPAVQLHQDLDWLKFGVHEKGVTEARIRKAFAEKIWITNSVAGWTATLDRLLREYYFNES